MEKMRYGGIVERQWLWYVGHLSARGSKIARKIESAAANEGVHARQEGLYPVYYGSRYYRGISRARQVAEEFSFGISIDAISQEREREEKSAPREIGYPRYFASRKCANLCFTFNKTKRGRCSATAIHTIEPLSAALFYRVYNPNASICIILPELCPGRFKPFEIL